MKKTIYILSIALMLPHLLSAEGFIEAGRVSPVQDASHFGVRVGLIQEFEGGVQELSRLVTRRTGSSSGDLPESYTFKELGFDDDYGTAGIVYQKPWKYFTFNFQANYFRPKVSTTAIRDFFIGVPNVEFGGTEYDYMFIPKGQKYTATLDNLLLRLGTRFTPLTFKFGEDNYVTPWIGLGVFSAIGFFEVDAGRATGLTQSENPPRDYVVKGKGDGINGGAIPEIGIGLDAYFQLTSDIGLELGGGIMAMEYDGRTDIVGIKSRNVKDLDASYRAAELSARLRFRRSETKDFFLGINLQTFDTDANTSADTDQTTKEILTKREKFDKNITLEFITGTIEAGFIF